MTEPRVCRHCTDGMVYRVAGEAEERAFCRVQHREVPYIVECSFFAYKHRMRATQNVEELGDAVPILGRNGKKAGF